MEGGGAEGIGGMRSAVGMWRRGRLGRRRGRERGRDGEEELWTAATRRGTLIFFFLNKDFDH